MSAAEYKTTSKVEAEAGACATTNPSEKTLAQKAGSFWNSYGLPTLKIVGLIGAGAAAGFYYSKVQSGKASNAAGMASNAAGMATDVTA